MISTPIDAQATFMNTGLALFADLPFKARDLSPETVRFGRKEMDLALVEMPRGLTNLTPEEIIDIARDIKDDVIAALGGDGPLAWQRPDRVIRQMAREEAERSQRDLMGLTREWLASENGTSLRESLRQSMGTVTNNIAALRAFAEGK